jgi:hypothetical protein
MRLSHSHPIEINLFSRVGIASLKQIPIPLRWD